MVSHVSSQKWSLTEEAFHGLLGSLGPDADTAAARYLEIRRNLSRLLEWRGCSAPDEYADEALNRCARKIADGEQIRDVATYCVGIARMLLRERRGEPFRMHRSLADVPEPRSQSVPMQTDEEFRLECVRRCLVRLSDEDRNLILNYYEGDKSARIEKRKELMRVLDLPASTLRMRALRIREKLHQWVANCLQRRSSQDLVSEIRRHQHNAAPASAHE